MSKPKHHRANAAQSSEPVNEHQSATDEPVNDSEQPISTDEPVIDETWKQYHESFKESILGLTKDQLLIWKNDIDTQLFSIDKKFAENLVLDFNKVSPELQKFILAEIGVTPKKPSKKATSTSGKKPRKINSYRGYKDIQIEGVDYKVALLINTDAQEFWRYGNPDQTPWLVGLKKEQRYAQFGSVEQLEKNPELLNEFARIPEAVLIKQANGDYENYSGKTADSEPAYVEDSE